MFGGKELRQNPTTLRERAREALLTRFTHSRLLTPLPSSPLGYQLQLIGNSSRYLTSQEESIKQKKIEAAQETLDSLGASNNIKVNITSVGVISSVQPDGSIRDIIQYTTSPSTYFEHRAAIDQTTPYETARKLTHSGATLVAITGDGMIALTSRKEQAIFPRNWDSTAQGSWDGQLQADAKTLVSPTPEKARAHIVKEAQEEVGLPKDVLESQNTHLAVLGVTEDSLKKHWDIIWLLRLPKEITAEKMRFFHTNVKNGQQDPNDPIAGHLTFIQANPVAIANFLTRMRSPSAPIAREALLLTGYMLRMQELLAQGNSQARADEGARKWMKQTELKTAARQIGVDLRVRRFRRKQLLFAWENYIAGRVQEMLGVEGVKGKAEVSKQNIRRYQSMPKGYNPHATPHDQGLPETKGELIRNGFIPSDVALLH